MVHGWYILSSWISKSVLCKRKTKDKTSVPGSWDSTHLSEYAEPWHKPCDIRHGVTEKWSVYWGYPQNVLMEPSTVRTPSRSSPARGWLNTSSQIVILQIQGTQPWSPVLSLTLLRRSVGHPQDHFHSQWCAKIQDTGLSTKLYSWPRFITAKGYRAKSKTHGTKSRETRHKLPESFLSGVT